MEHTAHIEPVELAPRVGRLTDDDLQDSLRDKSNVVELFRHPAEACTEVGADLSAPELDAVFPLNRYFRLYPVRTYFAVVLFVLVLWGWASASDWGQL